MTKLPTLRPLVRQLDAKVVGAQTALTANFYHSAPYRRWRDAVKEQHLSNGQLGHLIGGAGHRCEAIEDGKRCVIRTPDRLYADHIHEIEDGGDRYDMQNGQCLCQRFGKNNIMLNLSHAHHEQKKALMRRERARDV